jgi:hypothetical protein
VELAEPYGGDHPSSSIRTSSFNGPLQKLSRGSVLVAWCNAAETTRPRRKKKRRFFPKALTDETTQRRMVLKSPEMTRGELYAYHRLNGTLGLFYAMYAEPQ